MSDHNSNATHHYDIYFYCDSDFVSSGGAGLFTFQCIFPNGPQLRRASAQTLVSAFFPFAVTFFIFVIWTIKAAVKKKPWSYLWFHWCVTILAVLHFFYIELTRNLVGIFNCTRVDNPDEVDHSFAIATARYWIQDPNIICYENSHMVLTCVVGVPLLMLVSIGMPIGLLIIFIKDLQQQRNSVDAAPYAFLYRSYRDECQYWEVIIMLRKGLLAVLAVFAFSLGPALQSTLALGVLFCASGLNQWKRPFVERGPNLNLMEDISISGSFLVFFMGLVFKDENTSRAGEAVASVVLIAALVGVISYLLLALMREGAKVLSKAIS